MIISDDDKNSKNKKPQGASKNDAPACKSQDLDAKELDFDKTYEKNIRPKTFDEYIGQSTLKETLKITIEASKKKKHTA